MSTSHIRPLPKGEVERQTAVLNRQMIEEAAGEFEAGVFGAAVHAYEQVGSTNDILREMAEAGAAEGTLVIAEEQTAGRGRMGRTWIAEPGTSLLMSVLFRPPVEPLEAHRLVMVMGLAAIEAGEAETSPPAPLPSSQQERRGEIRIDVKWPNDLQIGGKKLAGILPESAIEGEQLRWVIVGMGLNVNQGFAADDPLSARATSLCAAAGREIDRARLLARILAGINHWYGRIETDALAETWRARCVTLGKRVHIAIPGGSLLGVAEDLDANGALWLRGDNGERHHLTLGEATVVADSR